MPVRIAEGVAVHTGDEMRFRVGDAVRLPGGCDGEVKLVYMMVGVERPYLVYAENDPDRAVWASEDELLTCGSCGNTLSYDGRSVRCEPCEAMARADFAELMREM